MIRAKLMSLALAAAAALAPAAHAARGAGAQWPQARPHHRSRHGPRGRLPPRARARDRGGARRHRRPLREGRPRLAQAAARGLPRHRPQQCRALRRHPRRPERGQPRAGNLGRDGRAASPSCSSSRRRERRRDPRARPARRRAAARERDAASSATRPRAPASWRRSMRAAARAASCSTARAASARRRSLSTSPAKSSPAPATRAREHIAAQVAAGAYPNLRVLRKAPRDTGKGFYTAIRVEEVRGLDRARCAHDARPGRASASSIVDSDRRLQSVLGQCAAQDPRGAAGRDAVPAGLAPPGGAAADDPVALPAVALRPLAMTRCARCSARCARAQPSAPIELAAAGRAAAFEALALGDDRRADGARSGWLGAWQWRDPPVASARMADALAADKDGAELRPSPATCCVDWIADEARDAAQPGAEPPACLGWRAMGQGHRPVRRRRGIQSRRAADAGRASSTRSGGTPRRHLAPARAR